MLASNSPVDNSAANDIEQAPHWSIVLVALAIAWTEFSTNALAFMLPTIEQAMGVNESLASLVVSVGLWGVAISAVLYGVLADHYGRRSVFLIAIGLFIAATLAMELTSTFSWFLCWRFFQGFGAGASWVVGCALLRDMTNVAGYRQAIARLHVSSGAIRGLCPVITVACLHWYGWHSVLLLLLVLAMCGWCGFWWRQPETLAVKSAIDWGGIMSRYAILWHEPQVRFSMTIKVVMVATLFVTLAQLPYQLPLYGMSMTQVSAAIMWQFGCFALGVLLVDCFGGRWSTVRWLCLGLTLCALAALGLLLSSSIVVVLWLWRAMFAGLGVVFANATALIGAAVPQCAAVASATMIACEMTMGGAAVFAFNTLFHQSQFALGLQWLVVSLLGLLLSRYGLSLPRRSA